jgi:hypothetical protein
LESQSFPVAIRDEEGTKQKETEDKMCLIPTSKMGCTKDNMHCILLRDPKLFSMLKKRNRVGNQSQWRGVWGNRALSKKCHITYKKNFYLECLPYRAQDNSVPRYHDHFQQIE